MKAIAVFLLIVTVCTVVASLIHKQERQLAMRSCEEIKTTLVKIYKPPFHSVWECVKIGSSEK